MPMQRTHVQTHPHTCTHTQVDMRVITLMPSTEYDGPNAPVQYAHVYQVLSPMLAGAEVASCSMAAGSSSIAAGRSSMAAASSGMAAGSSSMAVGRGCDSSQFIPPWLGMHGRPYAQRRVRGLESLTVNHDQAWDLDPTNGGSTGPVFNCGHGAATNLTCEPHRPSFGLLHSKRQRQAPADAAAVVPTARALRGGEDEVAAAEAAEAAAEVAAAALAAAKVTNGSHWNMWQPRAVLRVCADIRCGDELLWDYAAVADDPAAQLVECLCGGLKYRHLLYCDKDGNIPGVQQMVKHTRAAAAAAATAAAVLATAEASTSAGATHDEAMGMVALHAFCQAQQQHEQLSSRRVVVGGVHTPVRAVSGHVFPYVGRMAVIGRRKAAAGRSIVQ